MSRSLNAVGAVGLSVLAYGHDAGADEGIMPKPGLSVTHGTRTDLEQFAGEFELNIEEDDDDGRKFIDGKKRGVGADVALAVSGATSRYRDEVGRTVVQGEARPIISTADEDTMPDPLFAEQVREAAACILFADGPRVSRTEDGPNGRNRSVVVIVDGTRYQLFARNETGNRTLSIIEGTDGVTDPRALTRMKDDGLDGHLNHADRGNGADAHDGKPSPEGLHGFYGAKYRNAVGAIRSDAHCDRFWSRQRSPKGQ